MPLANTFKALPRLTFSVLCCGRSDQEAMESQDRISDLPDSMLLHILSFLSMKEVVLTGVLSKRWDHLWTKAMHLRYLGPRITTSYKEDKERFFKFVIHTLNLRETNPIEEFSLDFPLSEHSPLEITILSIHVFTWIHFAVKRKVKIICLDFSNNDYFLRSQIPFKLPSPLFSCDSVKWLSLAYCIIDRDRQISWNSLGELCLKEVRLSDDVVQKILSGAPLLVELTLYFCTGMENLNITSRNLKILHLSLTSQSKLSISAPYLRTLEIRGGVARYNLMKVSSLSMVKIFPGMAIIGSSHQDKLERLLQSVQHAQYLTLSSHCLQVLYMLEVKGFPTSYSQCSFLELRTDMNKSDFPGIITLLRTCQNLQTLCIDSDVIYRSIHLYDVPQKYDFDDTNYWSSLLPFPCLTKTLETVKLFGFTGGSSEMRLMEFLLDKAQVLQEMKIYCKTTDDMLKISQKLLSFRRASPNAVVLLS